ncbi:MAG: NAD(P)H-dependent oxidoreductase [Litorimonas sp.]
MSKNVAILYGHPDGSSDRLSYALAKSYQDASQLSGHATRMIKLSDLEFNSVTSQSEFRDGVTPHDILQCQDTISWADHILFIFPLWMGSMPGRFKMLLEQIFRPGFAIDYTRKGFPGKLLRGKTADIVVTMGMPTVAYQGFQFSHGVRNLKRNILHFSGIGPVRVTYFGGIDQVKPKTIEKWFNKMTKLGSFPFREQSGNLSIPLVGF